MMKTRIRLQAKINTILVIVIMAIYSTGCGNSPAEQPTIEIPGTPPPAFSLPTSTATPLLLIETPFPSLTPSSPIATVIPMQTVVSTPTSVWKAGWVDFVNDYYGYAVSLPPSAVVTKLGPTGYSPDELPADWDMKDNYFDYINMTYPPGMCISIQDQFGVIQIAVADWLGGKYTTECRSFGGLGVAHWTWSEEDVFVGEAPFTATVLGQCEGDAPDAKCSTQAYGIPMKDNAGIVVFGDDPILFEILRSFRSVRKTETYCPKPAPTRLKVGESAYVSTDPPLSYNNVREAPGINQILVGKIEPGRAVELLEGPLCNNSLQWWKVRVSNTSFEGWTPEGDHKRFWLVPCESKENCGKP